MLLRKFSQTFKVSLAFIFAVLSTGILVPASEAFATTGPVIWPGSETADPACVDGQSTLFQFELTKTASSNLTAAGNISLTTTAGNYNASGTLTTSGNAKGLYSVTGAYNATATLATVTGAAWDGNNTPSLTLKDVTCTGQPIAPTNDTETQSLPGAINCINDTVTVQHQARTRSYSWNGTGWVAGEWSAWTNTTTSETAATDEQCPPVVHDECLALLGNQPAGASCTAPVDDWQTQSLQGAVDCGEDTVTVQHQARTRSYSWNGTGWVAGEWSAWTNTTTSETAATDEQCPPADLCRNVPSNQATLEPYSPYVFVQGNGNCKITICHRTNATKNPYRQISVSLRAVDGQGNNDHSGHDEGPVFDPTTMTNGDDWGDIIPPNFHDEDGLNWEEGQAILDNDCVAPKGATTAEPRMRDFCGESHDRVVIPNREGVVYSIDGEPVSSGSWLVSDVDQNSDSVLDITAAAAEGYVLHENSKTEWTFEYTDENCLTITKTLNEFTDMNGDDVIGIGDRAYWTITVTNNGDQTVERFTVDVSDIGATVEGDSSVENLKPGESFVLSAYTAITSANIGTVCKVTNTASFGANYKERGLREVVSVETEEPDYEFTGTVNAEAIFVCPPTGGQVGGVSTGGGRGGGQVLAAATQAVLPAVLPSTGAKDSPFMILAAALLAYGAAYFLQGRRLLGRKEVLSA